MVDNPWAFNRDKLHIPNKHDVAGDINTLADGIERPVRLAPLFIPNKAMGLFWPSSFGPQASQTDSVCLISGNPADHALSRQPSEAVEVFVTDDPQV